MKIESLNLGGIFCGFVIVTLIHMNDDKEPVEQTEGGEGGENGQITQETLDNANVEVGHCKHWALILPWFSLYLFRPYLKSQFSKISFLAILYLVNLK